MLAYLKLLINPENPLTLLRKLFPAFKQIAACNCLHSRRDDMKCTIKRAHHGEFFPAFNDVGHWKTF